jgi:Mg2+-importing ATPase
VAGLAVQGVRTVVVTGDAGDVATAVCRAVGIAPGQPVLGSLIDRLDEPALADLAATTTVFVEVDPLHKARIVRALQRGGHVVGYRGDGINDTPALHAADIGLAVRGAAGVARQAADAVLLDKDLAILHRAVPTARHATLNATKYLKATLSANLGNVLSLLVAGAFLPFLPMLPLQFLIQNLGYDLAQLTLPTDHVDTVQLTRPHRWNTRDLASFSVCFAILSSGFDLATFWLLHRYWSTDGPALFRTGWFIANLSTQLIAILVFRTQRAPLIQSRPSRSVALAVLAGCALAVALPYTSWGASLQLQPPPWALLGALGAVAACYLATLQLAKMGYCALTGRWL